MQLWRWSEWSDSSRKDESVDAGLDRIECQHPRKWRVQAGKVHMQQNYGAAEDGQAGKNRVGVVDEVMYSVRR
jgi:hypothetical protein